MINLMCENYRRAAENRERVKQKQNILGYLEIEAIVNSCKNKPLPLWVTTGKLPTVDDLKDLPGFHEVDIYNGK